MRWAVALRWGVTCAIWCVLLLVPYSIYFNVKDIYGVWFMLVGVGALLEFVRQLLINTAYLINLKITHLNKKYDY